MQALTVPAFLRTPIISLAAVATLGAMPTAANAAVFVLTATDIVITDPSPLFATPTTISGTLTLDDSILPGQSFGSSAITALTLNFGGIVGTLADIAADVAPGPVQGFGTRSLDGNSFSVFDLRFGFTTPDGQGCGFICAGQIIINSPIGGSDVSNFIAADDGGFTIGIIDSFTPQFALSASVPEPSTWALIIGGFGAIGAVARSRRRSAIRVRFSNIS